VKNITKDKKVEIKFENNNKLWQITLDAMSESVFLIDLDHKILQCNKATLDILGKSNYNEIIDHSCWELLHCTSVRFDLCPLKRMRQTGQRETTIQKVNGKWVEISVEPVFNEEGGITGAVHIITDINSRKKAEDALKESEQKYLTILNSLSDPMHVVDKDLKITFQNPAMFQWLENLNLKSDNIGKSIFEAFPFLDYDKVYNEYDKVFKDRNLIITPEVNELFDRIVFTETLKIPIISENEVNHIITILRDITHHKEAEQKLKISEEKYKNIINNLIDIIIILDLKGNFQYISPQVYDISGFKPEEIIGKNGFRLMHPDDIKDSAEILKETIEKNKKVNIEFRTIHKDGHYINVLASGRIVNINGEDRIFAVVRDISDQKKAEGKLKDSEEKYRYLIENALEGVWVIDSNADTILVNPSMANILGYSAEEMIEKSLFSFMDKKAVKITKKHLEKRKKGISEERDAEMIHKNGKKVFLRIRPTPIFNDLGKYEGTYAFLADITQRKLVEQKLKESEEKYRYISENAYDLITIFDDNFNYEYINEQPYLNLLGYTVDDLIGKNGVEYLHPDEKEHIIEKFKKVLTEGRNSVFVRLKHKLGHYIWTVTNGTLFIDKNGNRKVIATTRDVTDKITAEEDLKKSEEKHRLMLENANDLITIINQEFKHEYINEKAYFSLLGYTNDDLIGQSPLDYLHPDDINKTADILKEGFEKGTAMNIFRLRDKNGHYHWLESRGKTFVDIDGKRKGLIISRDITERKKAEQKLKESEEKYRLISENTDDLILVYNADGILEYMNTETHSRILGYNLDKFSDKSFRDALVHEEDKETTYTTLKESLNKGNFQHQFRLRHKTGNFLWFEVTGKTFIDNYSNKKILCIARNVDDKRSAEYKIKESEENFRTIAEQAFIGTLIIQDDKVEYVNSALLQIFEYSHEEINYWRKKDLIKLIYPEDLQYLREYRKKLRVGESDIKQYYSYRVFTKYGRIKWIDQFSRPIIYRGKSAEIVTIMDITEKKRAEQELIKLNSLKSELLRRTSHELKTPLVSIKGFSDLLLTVHKDKLDDYVLATIHEIKLGCERLENLIKDILKTAELESESVELKKTEEDISFLIKLCVKELQGLIRLRNHNINLEIHDKLITRFEPDQIHLVLSNLLNNAIKYTPPNGKIKIKSDQTKDSILISIQDNGIGITNEEKKRLFSQFGKIERYGQGLDIISDGSGLGLFITKKIIELHGGKIWVRSKGRSKGSTFYFTLPLITQNKE